MKINEIITESILETDAWQKKSGKNKNGGLNKKGVDSYRRSHPGRKQQLPKSLAKLEQAVKMLNVVKVSVLA